MIVATVSLLAQLVEQLAGLPGGIDSYTTRTGALDCWEKVIYLPLAS